MPIKKRTFAPPSFVPASEAVSLPLADDDDEAMTDTAPAEVVAPAVTQTPPPAEYVEVKSALEVVLKRALKRTS